MRVKRYYIFQSGKLVRKDNTLYFINSETKKTLPITSIEEIFLMGEVSVTGKLLTFLAQKEVTLHNFNYYGYYSGSYFPRKGNVSGNLIIKQVDAYQNKGKRAYISQKIIEGLAKNIKNSLLHYKRKGVSLKSDLKKIDKLLIKSKTSKEPSFLLQVEGGIWKVFYHSFNKFLPEDFEFNSRNKRPPQDQINTLISFGNSILYTKVLSEIYHTSLNPTISYLHEPFERRFSLSLDLAEIFKAPIVFKSIFKLINKKILKREDFEKETNKVFLNKKGRKKFLKEIDERLNKTYKHKKLKRKVSYSYTIRLECFKLIKYLIEDKDYQPFNSKKCI